MHWKEHNARRNSPPDGRGRAPRSFALTPGRAREVAAKGQSISALQASNAGARGRKGKTPITLAGPTFGDDE